MKVIAVNGISDSGKTTVCESIISSLRKRGYSVGSIKEIHSEAFAIESGSPGSNTSRHRAAGAELVTARGFYETDLMFTKNINTRELLGYYEQDFVIMEGVSDCNAPRILTASSEEELDERMDGRVIAVSGVISNGGMDTIRGLPVFNPFTQADTLADFVISRAKEPLPDMTPECCTACGHTCRELACLVAQEKASVSDCILCSQEVTLTVGGKPVTMVPFVQRLLRNAVLGITSELDGITMNGELSVKFNLPPE